MTPEFMLNFLVDTGRRPDHVSRCHKCGGWLARWWIIPDGPLTNAHTIVQGRTLTNPGQWPPRIETTVTTQDTPRPIKSRCRKCKSHHHCNPTTKYPEAITP